MIPYGHHWLDEEDIQAVVDVLRSNWITQGPKIEEFEKALASYCGAKYAVAVSSGTAALHLACLAAGIKTGDEVITSPITFVASANCVLYCGGRPVFADVQPDTINIDPKKIKELLNPKTKAIIPVHFAGQPYDLEKISDIAKEHNLIVIEDAAHALGAEYRIKETRIKGLKGQGLKKKELKLNPKDNPDSLILNPEDNSKEEWVKVGSCCHSDMTVFSFHPVKSITTGEGGAILTNRKDLYEKLLMLRSHGITKNPKNFLNPYPLLLNPKDNPNPWYYEMQELGFNYRITDFQCALGLSQLSKLDSFIARHREIAIIYNEAFKAIEGIKVLTERDYIKSAWHLYVVLVKNRKQVFKKLREAGIFINVHYIPVYLQPYYRSLGYQEGLCPNAEDYYDQAISLPMFPKITDEELRYVIDKVKEAVV